MRFSDEAWEDYRHACMEWQRTQDVEQARQAQEAYVRWWSLFMMEERGVMQ